MKSTMTKHALKRKQQRGIPTEVDELLERYGCQVYRCGAITYFFDHKSKREIRRDHSRNVAKAILEDYGNYYKVTSKKDNATITIGIRNQRIKR